MNWCNVEIDKSKTLTRYCLIWYQKRLIRRKAALLAIATRIFSGETDSAATRCLVLIGHECIVNTDAATNRGSLAAQE